MGDERGAQCAPTVSRQNFCLDTARFTDQQRDGPLLQGGGVSALPGLPDAQNSPYRAELCKVFGHKIPGESNKVSNANVCGRGNQWLWGDSPPERRLNDTAKETSGAGELNLPSALAGWRCLLKAPEHEVQNM